MSQTNAGYILNWGACHWQLWRKSAAPPIYQLFDKYDWLPFFRLLWEVTSREDDRDASLSEEDTKPTLMYAKWMSSEDSNTDAILFVENYNIFYIPDVGVEEKKVYPVSQTEVVIPEVIFHGVPDWIYEGESKDWIHGQCCQLF